MLRFFSLCLLALVPFTAQAYELKRDSSGEEVRWLSAPHFVLAEDTAQRLQAQGAQAAVEAAMQTLRDAVPGLELSFETGSTGTPGYEVSKGTKNKSEISVPEAWEYDERALAVTIVTVDTRSHSIIDADILFNAEHRRFGVLAATSRPGGELDDIQNTFTHELGHALGLGHNPEAPEAVMYPSAVRGEVVKRTLSTDDRDGLLSLYAQAQEQNLQDNLSQSIMASGCSSSGQSLSLWMLMLALPFWMRALRSARRASALALTVLVPAAALASDPSRAAAAVEKASVVATAQVVQVRALPAQEGQGLFFSELEVEVRTCIKGVCPKRLMLRVPGGRSGHIEQFVEGAPVPQTGAVLGVTVPAQASAASVGQKSASGRTAIYRLDSVSDFSAFAAGLAAAGIKTDLLSSGSLPTQSSALTQTPSR